MSDTTSLADWKSADTGSRLVTLPSGAKVRLKVADLATHLRYGAIPNELRRQVFAALGRRTNEQLPEDDRDAAQRDVDRGWLELLADVIVAPRLTVDDLLVLPTADVSMLLDLANRRISFDAAGVPFGVVAVDPFGSFRDERRGADDRDPEDRPGDPDAAGDE